LGGALIFSRNFVGAMHYNTAPHIPPDTPSKLCVELYHDDDAWVGGGILL